MRKFLALFLSFMILWGACPVSAENASACADYSAEAAEAFCDAWNPYFAEKDMDVSVGYFLSDNKKQMESFDVMFNNTKADFSYASGIIPSDATLYIIYDIAKGSYGFCVVADELKGELEKAVIYTDDRVFSDLAAGTNHDEAMGYDMWSVTVDEGAVLSLMDYDMFTVRLTVDGKSEVFDVSDREYDYLYNLVDCLLRMALYSDTTCQNYRSADYLPVRPEETAKPENTENPVNTQGGAYSFREDLEGLDKAAKSVFYVEVFDGMFNCLGNASGFVAFDEHLFVTNQHVIDGASYMMIWDEENRKYLLDTVAVSDRLHDVAILPFDDGKKYDALEYDLDAELMRGQPVVTIGSPNGFQGTVAFGNISAFPVIPQYGNEKCIQYTAPTSHGSSGGVLFDDRGKVIGITSAVYAEGQNLNFAIPIRLVKDLHDGWDGKSTVKLGSERSWDTVGSAAAPEATPTPVVIPDVTAIPTAEATKAPEGSKEVRDRVDLTAANFPEYFDVTPESDLDGKNATFRFTIAPKDPAAEFGSGSSYTIFVTVRFGVYSDASKDSEIARTETTVMLKRDEGYRYRGEAKLKLEEVPESVYWDGEVTYVRGHLN